MRENFFESWRRLSDGIAVEFAIPVSLMLIALVICAVMALVLRLLS